MTRKAVRIDAIIPLAAQRSPARAITATNGAVVPGCESDWFTADFSVEPGSRWKSQSTMSRRSSEGNRRSSNETTRATSGTSENNTR